MIACKAGATGGNSLRKVREAGGGARHHLQNEAVLAVPGQRGLDLCRHLRACAGTCLSLPFVSITIEQCIDVIRTSPVGWRRINMPPAQFRTVRCKLQTAMRQ